jgi:hypothetical protein
LVLPVLFTLRILHQSSPTDATKPIGTRNSQRTPKKAKLGADSGLCERRRLQSTKVRTDAISFRSNCLDWLLTIIEKNQRKNITAMLETPWNFWILVWTNTSRSSKEILRSRRGIRSKRVGRVLWRISATSCNSCSNSCSNGCSYAQCTRSGATSICRHRTRVYCRMEGENRCYYGELSKGAVSIDSLLEASNARFVKKELEFDWLVNLLMFNY